MLRRPACAKPACEEEPKGIIWPALVNDLRRHPLASREVGSVKIGGIVERTAHPKTGPLTGGPRTRHGFDGSCFSTRRVNWYGPLAAPHTCWPSASNPRSHDCRPRSSSVIRDSA